MTFCELALEMIKPEAVVGLGTGRAATQFIHALGERVKAGLRIRGVPTSRASEALAVQLGIPLANLEEVEAIDVAVDGADEIDPNLNLIKGLGGALVREKIVASAARRFVIVAGPSKRVPVLGTRGVLPVEVVPFGLGSCRRKLESLGLGADLRMLRAASGGDESPFRSDNGNLILDCKVGPMDDPARLDAAIRAIPGVVGTGLFLNMADVALLQDGNRVEVVNAPEGSTRAHQ